MQLQITKAERKQKKSKIILSGPAKSGKTLTALRVGRGLVGPEGRILLLDSERGSATLYANDADYGCEFFHADLPNADPETYIAGLYQAAKLGYDLVIIDSLSHGWEAVLEMHTAETLKQKTTNSFTAWAPITPIYRRLINAILSYPGHTIVTARAKSAYVLEEVEKNGKKQQAPKKVGMAPILRPGSEFEFDLIGQMDIDHNLIVEGTRYRFLDGKVINKPGEELGQEISAWLGSGKAKEAPAKRKPGEKPNVTSEYDVSRESHPYAYSYDDTEMSRASDKEQLVMWKTLQDQYGAMRLGRVIRTVKPIPGWEDSATQITED